MIAVNGRSAMRPISVVLRLLVVALVVGIRPTLADRTEPVWWVSAPTLKVAYPERVVGFDLKLIGGFIQSVADIPTGWSISIVNDSSERADISGNTQRPAAALEADYFRRFVAIQQQEPDPLPISVRLEVVVTSDFKHQRHMEVPSSQLVLSKESK